MKSTGTFGTDPEEQVQSHRRSARIFLNPRIANLTSLNLPRTGTRCRGLLIEIHDEEALEDSVRWTELIQAAVKNSALWFNGKVLDRQQIEDRYKPILTQRDDGSFVIKAKVKCAGQMPTQLNLLEISTLFASVAGAWSILLDAPIVPL